MARYSNLMRSNQGRADMAIKRKIQAFTSSDSQNYYTTGGTLGGDNILTGSRNNGTWTADLSALAATSSPGGSTYDIQYKTAINTFGGITMTQGTLLSATDAGVPSLLASGTNTYALVADSTTASGLNWASVTSHLAGADTYVGYFTAAAALTGTANFTYDGSYLLAFGRSNASAYGANFNIKKSRGSVGSEGDVTTGDTIGQINFTPYYGDYDNYAARIEAAVEGTLGTNITPGRLVFSTAAASANTVTERMRIDSAGNVGIGTAAPSVKLDVVGDIQANNIVVGLAGTDDYGRVSISGNALGGYIEKFGSDSDGAVGFYAGAGQRGILLDATNNFLTAGTRWYVQSPFRMSGTNALEFNDDEHYIYSDGTDLHIKTTTTASQDIALTSTGKLVVDAGDDINLDAHSSVFNFKRQGSEMFRLTCGASSPIAFQPKQDAYDIAFNQYDGTEVMRITDGAKVGIGTTAPAEKLTVGGNGKFLLDYHDTGPKSSTEMLHIVTSGSEAAFAIEAQSASSGIKNMALLPNLSQDIKNLGQYWDSGGGNYTDIYEWGWDGDATPANRKFQFKMTDEYPIHFIQDNNDRLVIASGGNVGIGTTAPTSLLDVSGGAIHVNAGADNANPLITGSTNTPAYTFYGDQDTGMYRAGANTLAFETAGTAAITIGSTQLVGIGRSPSTYKLEVAGDIANFSNSSKFYAGTTQQAAFYYDGHMRLKSDGTIDLMAQSATGRTRFLSYDSGDIVEAIISGSSLSIKELAAAPTQYADYGFFWVSGSTPNKPMFTDDDGTAFDLSAGEANVFTGEVTAGYIPIAKTTTDVLEEFVEGLTETNSLYIGENPSSTTSNAEYNTSLGIGALAAVTTADSNVAIGYNALTAFTTDSGQGNQTAVGYKALTSVVDSGQGNSVLGYQAAQALTVGDYNVVLGLNAMYAIDTGSHNIFIGRLAGSGTAGTVTDGNVGIGTQTLQNLNGGDNNVAIGKHAAESTTTGHSSAYIGYYAGYYETTSYGNVAMGHVALQGETGKHNPYNVALGYKAMTSASGSSNNVAIGFEAFKADALTGDDNVAIGYRAGLAVTTAASNVMIGQNVNKTATTGNYNVIIGQEAAQSSTGMDNCVVIGRHAVGGGTAAGDNNVSIGYQAGYAITEGGTNTFVGKQAGDSVTTGQGSVIIGADAGQSFDTESYVTVVGKDAFKDAVGDQYAIAIGYRALADSDATGGQNVAMGQSAGRYFGSSTSDSVVIGGSAGAGSSSTAFGGTSVVAVGGNAVQDLVSGSYTIGIGRNALSNTISGQTSIAIGANAGQNALNIHAGIFIGDGAGRGAGGGATAGIKSNYDIGIGYQAGMRFGSGATATYSNVAIGPDAMGSVVTGNYNVAIGHGAASGAADIGDQNVAIGYFAGKVSTGNYNVFVGASAGLAASSTTLSTIVGKEAGQGVMTGGSNSLFGYRAGYSLTSAHDNTIIGKEAAQNATTVMRESVIIGMQAMNSYTTNSSHGRFTVVGAGAASNVVSTNSGKNNYTAIGFYAGYNDKSDANHQLFGASAGYYLSGTIAEAADACTFVGLSAGKGDVLGFVGNATVGIGGGVLGDDARYSSVDVFIGGRAGNGYVSGSANVVIGFDAMRFGGQATLGATENVAVGYQAGYSLGRNAAATGSVAIGKRAGYFVSGGSKNVYIGYDAGPSSATATESNQLYIHNTNGTPLIGGDFSTPSLTFNADDVDITSATASKPVLMIKNTNADANAGELQFYKKTTGEADNDLAGNISFYFDNDGSVDGVEKVRAAQIYATSVDVTEDSEDGAIFGKHVYNGTEYQNIHLGGHYNASQTAVWVGEEGTTGFLGFANNTADNNYLLFGTRHTTGSSNQYTVAGFTVGNNAMAGNQQLNMRAQDDITISAGFDGSTTNSTIKFQTNDTAETTPTTRMTIDKDGNIGMGTTGPDAKLEIIATTEQLRLTHTDASKYTTFTQDGNDFTIKNEGSGDDIIINPNDKVQLHAVGVNYATTADTAYLYIQPTGTDGGDGAKIFNLTAGQNISIEAKADTVIKSDGTSIGTFSSTGLVVTGTVSATAKSFNIPHPLYKDKRLVHGSLEGPEHGLYIRGTIEAIEGGLIELPEYWSAMCEDYTVQLTPHGAYTVFIEEKQMDKIMVGCTEKNFKFDYYIVGARTDETLEVVQDG